MYQDVYRANHVDIVTRILKLGSKYIHKFAYNIPRLACQATLSLL